MTSQSSDATATIEDIRKDLQTLRGDVGRLARAVADLLRTNGSEAVRTAKAKGQETADTVSEMADSFAASAEESMRSNPLITLALALGVGFVVGAMWHRRG